MKSFITLFIFCCSWGFSQEVQVHYEIVRSTSLADNVGQSENFKEKIKEQEKNAEKYVLYYTNGDSFFKSDFPEDITHNNAPVIIGTQTKYLKETSHRVPVKIYHLKREDLYYQYSESEGEQFYKAKASSFNNINFTDKTAKIENYACKMATATNASGITIQVWYTEEIPISTGPFTFGNFPGLVLKVEHPTYLMYATKVDNKVNQKEIEKMNPKFPITDL